MLNQNILESSFLFIELKSTYSYYTHPLHKFFKVWYSCYNFFYVSLQTQTSKFGYYLIGKLHSFIYVTWFTKLLCPVLMAKALTPYTLIIFKSSVVSCCLLFVYIYSIILVLLNRLTISMLLSNDIRTLKQWFRKQNNLKKIGLY